MNLFQYLIFPIKTSFKDWKTLFFHDPNYITEGPWFHLNTNWQWSFGDDFADFIIKNRGKFAVRKIKPTRPYKL